MNVITQYTTNPSKLYYFISFNENFKFIYIYRKSKKTTEEKINGH